MTRVVEAGVWVKSDVFWTSSRLFHYFLILLFGGRKLLVLVLLDHDVLIMWLLLVWQLQYCFNFFFCLNFYFLFSFLDLQLPGWLINLYRLPSEYRTGLPAFHLLKLLFVVFKFVCLPLSTIFGFRLERQTAFALWLDYFAYLFWVWSGQCFRILSGRVDHWFEGAFFFTLCKFNFLCGFVVWLLLQIIQILLDNLRNFTSNCLINWLVGHRRAKKGLYREVG